MRTTVCLFVPYCWFNAQIRKLSSCGIEFSPPKTFRGDTRQLSSVLCRTDMRTRLPVVVLVALEHLDRIFPAWSSKRCSYKLYCAQGRKQCIYKISRLMGWLSAKAQRCYKSAFDVNDRSLDMRIFRGKIRSRSIVERWEKRISKGLMLTTTIK